MSIVAIKEPLSKYSKDELIILIKVARKNTIAYDRLFGYRRGANIWVIDKENDKSWLCKRLSSQFGCCCPSIEDVKKRILGVYYDEILTMPDDLYKN